MNYIDTHAHLFSEEFDNDLEEVVARAKAAGVTKVLLPNIDLVSIHRLKQCVSDYPLFFYPMMGLHPTSVTSQWQRQLEEVERELRLDNYVAVGEIGIDLYWDTTLKEAQIAAFEEQLRWSADMNLPVSIHFRNATEEVIRCIHRVGASSLRGVFHSFGGSRDELEAILALGNFMVGINGVVTFKNAGISETLKYCPVDRLVLETDSPYLAPVPFRGKRNESGYLQYIVSRLAQTWGMDTAQVGQITSDNAAAMFNFNDTITL